METIMEPSIQGTQTQEKTKPETKPKPSLLDISITKENEQIQITTPYNPDFIKKIKKAGGRWKPDTRKWLMDSRNLKIARDIMFEVYGRDDLPTKTTSVLVKVRTGWNVKRGPVIIMGRVIGSASSRDSGARIGEDVCFVKGSVNSGGSIKNWFTFIEDKTEIILHDVPLVMIERARKNPNIMVEPLIPHHLISEHSIVP